MKKYVVGIVFSGVYEVEAENEDEAETLALDIAEVDVSDICINIENVNFVDEVEEDEND